MSLATDKVFKTLLAQSTELAALVGTRITNTVDDEVNTGTPTKFPYLVICNDGTVNDESSKDDQYESDYDRDTIRIEVVAKTRAKLATLATLVRNVIKVGMIGLTDEQWTALGFHIDDYQFSASPVQFDDLVTCHWQSLTYLCDVENYE